MENRSSSKKIRSTVMRVFIESAGEQGHNFTLSMKSSSRHAPSRHKAKRMFSSVEKSLVVSLNFLFLGNQESATQAFVDSQNFFRWQNRAKLSFYTKVRTPLKQAPSNLAGRDVSFPRENSLQTTLATGSIREMKQRILYVVDR